MLVDTLLGGVFKSDKYRSNIYITDRESGQRAKDKGNVKNSEIISKYKYQWKKLDRYCNKDLFLAVSINMFLLINKITNNV